MNTLPRAPHEHPLTPLGSAASRTSGVSQLPPPPRDLLRALGALLTSHPQMEPCCAPGEGSKPPWGSALHIPSWSGTALTTGPSPPPHTPHVPAAPGEPSKRLSQTGDKGRAQGPGGTPTLSQAASSDRDPLGNTDQPGEASVLLASWPLAQGIRAASQVNDRSQDT